MLGKKSQPSPAEACPEGVAKAGGACCGLAGRKALGSRGEWGKRATFMLFQPRRGCSRPKAGLGDLQNGR